MSLTAPPSRHLPQQPEPLTLKARLARKWRHWEEIPLPRFCLLLLSTALLLAITPLLPLAACALWWWAAHSWDWRDRWTSMRSWAKQGGTFVALVLVFAFLSSAQVWILPQLTAALQAFWSAHLRGDLSLVPTDLDGLLARALLLLPLAPALALLYERIDPRTLVQLQRILTPADLVEPTPPPPAEPVATAAPPPAARQKAQAPPKAKAATPRKRTRTRPGAQQTTIESFLAPDPAQVTPASPSDQAARQPVTPPPKAPDAPAPPAAQPINWDDVAN